jgi:hypothetical protein
MNVCLKYVGVVVGLVLLTATPVVGQQRGSISGRVIDPSGLVLPGVTVTVTEQNTGFIRTVVTAENGAYAVPNLDPGTYTIVAELSGFAPLSRKDVALTAGLELPLELKMQLAGVAEELVVTGEAPLVDRSSNRIGGNLSSQEIEEVPSNFRNFTALTQLIPGMTPNPAQSSFEGGQVVANGVPSQSNVYLIDGMYNNDDRLGGSQGTQVRVVLDNIEEYQVLSNQYSAEYGGGAGAIINMVTRGGSNSFSGRAYSYFRDDAFNARGHFLTEGAPKPEEGTLQAGFALGGPIIRNRAHFYFTYERDNEEQAGEKKFPALAAPLATDFVGTFEVGATNYFGRGDLQINDQNFVNVRWVLETAPTKGEGFNTNTETIDAQSWESDWDQLFNVAFTSVLSDRASNVIRVGRIGEQLGTGQQAFFDEDVNQVGFDGRDPFSIGQRNDHPSYETGKGGTGVNTRIRTYTIDNSFSYFVPDLRGEHTFKTGGGWSRNSAVPRENYDSGIFLFTGANGDLPYDPANPLSYPAQFDIQVGPPGNGYPISTKDYRFYFFGEDKWRVTNNVTVNLGLRYDHQDITPNSKDDFAPRGGFAWDLNGNGSTVVRGGIGRFYSYVPISVGLNLQQAAPVTLYPTITITDRNSAVLKPDMVTDSQGNPGVAVLSAAGKAELEAIKTATLNGNVYNRDPRVDDPNRQLPYQWAWSVGVAHQILATSSISVDYVGNRSRDQLGVVDINEPVNGVRPGTPVYDSDGNVIPFNFRRVLQSTTGPGWNGDYESVQIAVVKRMANRWSGRVAYTVQKSHSVGIGNPDTRRVWLDNELSADYGRFAGDRRQVLAVSGTYNLWRALNVATVVSAISGSAVNEIVGADRNADTDNNNDRPIAGIDDVNPLPSGKDPKIYSEVDSQGRAVIHGIDGPGSFGVDLSFRYQLPLTRMADSLDLFYDIFNVFNNTNYSVGNTYGNRSSGSFLTYTSANFARQMQFGVRVRF